MFEITIKGFSVALMHSENPTGYNYTIKLNGSLIASGFTPGGRLRVMSEAFTKIEEAIRKANGAK